MPVSIGGSGPITGVTSINTTVTDTELGYLDGVTSAVQTQINAKADTTSNGAWTTWAPTWTSGTGSLTTVTTNFARYVRLGKLVVVSFEVTINNAGTGGGGLRFSLPVTARTAYCGSGSVRERAINGLLSIAQVFDTATAEIIRYDNASPIATNATLFGTLTYEAA